MRSLFGKEKRLKNDPSPSWIPDHFEEPSMLLEKLAFFTSEQKPFVVYKYGTAVFPSDVKDWKSECSHHLKNAVSQSPDFKVTRMNSGDYLVGFNGPIYGLVFSDFFLENEKQIQTKIQAGGLIQNEEIIVPEGVPEIHYYVGLYARAKLYADASSLEPECAFNLS